MVTDGKKEIILSTALGIACRFTEDQIRTVGRTARGVTGMRFKLKGDYVVSMEAVDPIGEIESDEEAQEKGGPEILVVSDGGLGKRSFVSQYRKTRRGAKGVLNIKLREKEKVVAAIQVSKGEELIIVTANGQTVRIPSDEIRRVGRASKGVKIMDLADGDSISGVIKLMEIREGDVPSNVDVQPDAGAALATAAAPETPASPAVPEEPKDE